MTQIRNAIVASFLVLALFQTSATCPYCGPEGVAPGHIKSVVTADGQKHSCEYSPERRAGPACFLATL